MTKTMGGRLLAAALFCLSGCSPGQAPGGDIAITIEPARSSQPAFVRVAGLSADEASQSESGVVTVSVQGADVAVVGRTVVNGALLEFHPAFPFDAGRPYVVTVDTSRWQTPRGPAITEAVLSLPRPAETARVTVASIRPSQNRWPDNTLRFYIHFSGPMSNDNAAGKVHLVGDDGEDVANALLPLNVDLWNADRTRFTVLFDPARVKRGILSNREMGRALISGRRYAIVVDADWRDAQGRPLASTYRHEFTAGPPLEQAIDTSAWSIAAPKAGTREALTVRFPFALDSALVERSIVILRADQQALAGKVNVPIGATEWQFTPDAAWTSGRHALAVSAVLEDPAGNRINRPFEADAAKVPATAAVETWRLDFEVKSR